MKKEEKQKIHQSTISELNQKAANLGKELTNISHQVKLGKNKDLKAASKIRHQIAIVKTIIRQKQLQTPKIKE